MERAGIDFGYGKLDPRLASRSKQGLGAQYGLSAINERAKVIMYVFVS